MELALTLLVIVALGVGAFYLSRLFFKKAVREVVYRLRKQGAVNAKSAASAEALGLVPRGFMDRMFRLRDYKPYALRVLMQADIVRATEDAKIYLSEQELERSPVKKFARIK